MSDAVAVRRRPEFDRLRRSLAGPAFGIDARRTVAGVAVVAAFLALVATTVALDRALELYEHWRLAAAVDELLWTLILGSQAALLLSVLYALWNGGPVTAVAIATLPEAVESTIHLRFVLSVDVVVTLVVASLAGTLALVVTACRRYGGLRPDRYAPLENGLLATSTVTAVALATYVELLAWDLPTVFVPMDLVGLGLVAPLAVLAVYWRGWLRAVSPTRPDPADGAARETDGSRPD